MPTYRVIEGGVARDMNAEEQAAHEAMVAEAATEEAAAHIERQRGVRNDLLAESDWVVAKATETGTSVPTAWSEYRTALRDITADENWPDMDWPTKPE